MSSKFVLFRLLLAAALALLLVGIWLARPVQADGPIHVDADATCGGSCNGETWSLAYPSLQDALAAATTGAEIWVATGVYTPGLTITDTFVLTDGVALYGGFVATETLRSQRDWQNNVTVLSGDIGGDDQTDAQGVITHTDYISGSNSTHVVTSQGVTETAVLDGFTITGGNAHDSSYPDDRGGGMFNEASSPTLTNVTFSGNSATVWGGGMFNDNSSPTLTNCTFSGNTATDSNGGGVGNLGSSPTLTNCTFSGNTAGEFGGGMYNYYSTPTLTNVTFSGNTATDSGGGMFNVGSNPTLINVTFGGNAATDSSGGGVGNLGSSPTLINCTFSGNAAGEFGGGIYNYYSTPTLTNVTFSGNTAVSNGDGMYNHNSSPALVNCILWSNTAPIAGTQIYNHLSVSPTISYSLVEGDCPAGSICDHVIDDDPQFVDANGPDNTPGTPDDNLRLGLTSPAIDAGDNTAPGLVGVTTDLAGQPRFVDVPSVSDTGNGDPPIVDMGAYEAPGPIYLPLILKKYP